jgi:flagellar motility protein MotE (MotC chaperone)
LVKIYENMKPSDAATIFNQLQMPILLSVIGSMSERKVAPVLASMDPKRAKEVTEELAELRKTKALPGEAAAPSAP